MDEINGLSTTMVNQSQNISLPLAIQQAHNTSHALITLIALQVFVAGTAQATSWA